MRLAGWALDAAEARWSKLGQSSAWSGAALVGVAWGLLALDRLGGLAFTEPRAFTRLAIAGVWGALGLTVGIWAIGRVLNGRAAGEGAPTSAVDSMWSTFAVVGWSHLPVAGLATVVLIVAGAMQILGPGLIVAVVVFAMLMPFALVTGVRHVAATSSSRAAAIVAIPYLVWLLVVARPALDSIGHLL